VRHIIEWPGGESLTRAQALAATGIPGRLFNRFVELGLIHPQGKDKRNRRYKWDEVYALARLWERLERFLPAEKDGGK
jgi:hypothetical protein